ncbi:unnamed protein product [Pleuronectes platessa]|uniref:Uncharacterized protein n=1 Tax=Pleuronectes platessa TaxID=8262 RepID=A0A9N7VI68_PLEPL|nr:unnamed protein product [Pleuronectes platessa]
MLLKATAQVQMIQTARAMLEAEQGAGLERSGSQAQVSGGALPQLTPSLRVILRVEEDGGEERRGEERRGEERRGSPCGGQGERSDLEICGHFVQDGMATAVATTITLQGRETESSGDGAVSASTSPALIWLLLHLSNPSLSLTFSDIYPPPQWQRPARSHRPAWVSLCGLKMRRAREGEQEKGGGREGRAEHHIPKRPATTEWENGEQFHRTGGKVTRASRRDTSQPLCLFISSEAAQQREPAALVFSGSTVACDLLWRWSACHCSLQLMQQEATPPPINACSVMAATAARGSDLTAHLSCHTNSGRSSTLMAANMLQGSSLRPPRRVAVTKKLYISPDRKLLSCTNR